jgi:pimeloyl-ACP methyl ester carboxylesterase
LESAKVFDFLYGRKMLKGYEWGEGERCILLVHGWESRGTALRSFVPALLEQGFRVITFDGPAHGHSDGKRTNLPHFAGAVRAIMSLKGPFYATIGHSFGGASVVYALNFLAPDQSIGKIVQIGVPSSMVKIFEDAVETLGLPSGVANAFKAYLETKAEGKRLEELELAEVYSSVRIGQGLFVHDREDLAVPITAAEKAIELWPESELLITEGYGHFRLMKNPDVIDAVVRFLSA